MSSKKPKIGPGRSPRNGNNNAPRKTSPASKVSAEVRSTTKYKVGAALLAATGVGAAAWAYLAPHSPGQTPKPASSNQSGAAASASPTANKPNETYNPEAFDTYIITLEEYLQDNPAAEETVSLSDSLNTAEILNLLGNGLTPFDQELEEAINEKEGLNEAFIEQVLQQMPLPDAALTEINDSVQRMGMLTEWLASHGVDIAVIGQSNLPESKQIPQHYLNVFTRLLNRRLLAKGFLLIPQEGSHAAYLAKVKSVQKATLKTEGKTFECAFVRLEDDTPIGGNVMASFDNATAVILSSERDGLAFIERAFASFRNQGVPWLQAKLLPELQSQVKQIDPTMNTLAHEVGHAQSLAEMDDFLDSQKTINAVDIFSADELHLLDLASNDPITIEQLDELSRFGAQVVNGASVSKEGGMLGLFAPVKSYADRRSPHHYALVDKYFGKGLYVGRTDRGEFRRTPEEALIFLEEMDLDQATIRTWGAGAKSLGEKGMRAIAERHQNRSGNLQKSTP